MTLKNNWLRTVSLRPTCANHWANSALHVSGLHSVIVACFHLGSAGSTGLSLRRVDRAGHWSRDAPMYWLVSLPLLDDSEERAWTLVQNRTTYESDLSSNYKFVLPELRVGTLDSLMVLSDDLVKVNGLVESVVNKVRRQLFEMSAINGSSDSQEARPCPATAVSPGSHVLGDVTFHSRSA